MVMKPPLEMALLKWACSTRSAFAQPQRYGHRGLPRSSPTLLHTEENGVCHLDALAHLARLSGLDSRTGLSRFESLSDKAGLRVITKHEIAQCAGKSY